MSQPASFTTPGLGSFAEAVDLECQRILRKWGDQHHPLGTGSSISREIAAFSRLLCQEAARTGRVTWRHILTEEFREAMAATNLHDLNEELVQVAAVCFMIISDLPRHPIAGGESDDVASADES